MVISHFSSASRVRIHWLSTVRYQLESTQRPERKEKKKKKKKNQGRNKKLSHPRITKTCNRFRTNPSQLNHSVVRPVCFSLLLLFFLLISSSSLMTHLAPVGRERRSTEYGLSLFEDPHPKIDLVQRLRAQSVRSMATGISINCDR